LKAVNEVHQSQFAKKTTASNRVVFERLLSTGPLSPGNRDGTR